MTPESSPAALSRRALLAGAAALAALPSASAFAATVAPRFLLPIGPFVARALDDLVADGRVTATATVASCLDGIAAFRAGDGEPLEVGDLDPPARDVDRFLATMLIERLAGESLADHLRAGVLPRAGLHDARLLGTPISAIECQAPAALRWLAG